MSVFWHPIAAPRFPFDELPVTSKKCHVGLHRPAEF